MKIEAATSDADGYGVTVSYDSASLTVQKAETLMPRLSSLRTATAMAMETCRELLGVAAPELARRNYAENKKGPST